MLPQQNDRPAILWVLSGTLIWTLIFAAGKFADGASGAVQITFLRYLGAFVTLALLLPWKGGLQSHRSKQPLVHLVRAVAGCSAAVAITWASSQLPLVNATAISMLYGVLAIILGTVFLKERLNRSNSLPR